MSNPDKINDKTVELSGGTVLVADSRFCRWCPWSIEQGLLIRGWHNLTSVDMFYLLPSHAMLCGYLKPYHCGLCSLSWFCFHPHLHCFYVHDLWSHSRIVDCPCFEILTIFSGKSFKKRTVIQSDKLHCLANQRFAIISLRAVLRK